MPKAWHRDFAACGQRSGLLALNLANIFEKLLDQKTFGCLRLGIENTILRKTTRIRLYLNCSVSFAPQMWATRPHLGSIFVKLLHRKTFQNDTVFSVKIFRCNCSTGTVTKYLFTALVHKAGRSCSPRLEKLSLFSPPPPCAKSMAQEFRCLRAAIRATRPEPRQHF